jgi:hypothetical protein
MAQLFLNRHDDLIRARHNRVLPKGKRLWSSVLATAALGEVTLTLPARRGRTARRVRQVLDATPVRLADGRGGHVQATCLIAQELDAPPGSSRSSGDCQATAPSPPLRTWPN